MSRISKIAARALVMTILTSGIVQAQDGSTILQDRLKTSLNGMVRNVQDAPTADAKRAVLEDFLTKIERGAEALKSVPLLSPDNRAALAVLETRFEGYATALHGLPAANGANEAVADSDLDAFASYMQNDLEQAQGVYLSTGAIIIVLLILLIIL